MPKIKSRLWMVCLLGVLLSLFLMPGYGIALQRGLYIADEGNLVVYYMDSQNNLSQFCPLPGEYLLGYPIFLETDLEGNLIISLHQSGTVIKAPPEGGTFETIAAGLNGPTGLAYDASGNLYVAEENGNIRRISPSGENTIIASGLGPLQDLKFDDLGNLYATVFESQGKLLRITRESLSGQLPVTVEVIYDRPVNENGLSFPVGVAFRNGNLYVADMNKYRIVRINPVTLEVSDYYYPIIAGRYQGGPFGIDFDEVGNVYFSAIDVLGMIDTNKNLTILPVAPNGLAGSERFGYAWGLLYVPDNIGPIPLDVAVSPNPARRGTSIVLTATLSDTTTGNSKIASAEYSLDGGNTWNPMSAQDGAFDSPTENVTARIGAFSNAGVYEVCIRGKDAAGNISDKGCTELAVEDATAGRVTGNGWITLPQGAYTKDPSLKGKAHFAFRSRYKKSANVPMGETKFHFKVGQSRSNKAAEVNFYSDSYQWLVMEGAKAQYKGTGTINGGGNYGFMLIAIDGQIDGKRGVDKFRIKIWDNTTGVIIFDNQMGASDTAAPTTGLGGGKIEIHY